MAVNFLSSWKKEGTNLFEASTSPFITEWKEEHGPIDETEALMLFGAVDAGSLEQTARLIPNNRHSAEAVFEVKTIPMLEVFLILGEDPVGESSAYYCSFAKLLRRGCHFRSVIELMWNFYRDTLPKSLFNFFSDEIANDWENSKGPFDTTSGIVKENIFSLRKYWSEFTIDLKRAKPENLGFAVEFAIKHDLLSKKEIWEFIEKHASCEPLLSTALKFFPEETTKRFETELSELTLSRILSARETTEADLLLVKVGCKISDLQINYS